MSATTAMIVETEQSVAEQPIEREQSSPSPAEMQDEPLAEIVIEGCQQFRRVIPYVIELRSRFKSRPRGNANIAGCSTWEEFCEKRLDRGIRAVQKAVAAYNNANKLKSASPTATAADLVAYEETHGNGFRTVAAKLIDDGLTRPDVVSALKHMGHPTTIAEAAVSAAMDSRGPSNCERTVTKLNEAFSRRGIDAVVSASGEQYRVIIRGLSESQVQSVVDSFEPAPFEFALDNVAA